MREFKLTSLIAETNEEEEETGCTSCMGRRDFFRVGATSAAIAALAAFLPREAAAAPLRWTTAAGRDGTLRYPFPDTEGVTVDKANEVILVRHQAEVAAFALSCPHQRSMLRWREGEGIFQCTKHHSEYSPTGVYEKGRATRNMDRLAVSREGNEVVVNPAITYQSDEDPAGWASAIVKVN